MNIKSHLKNFRKNVLTDYSVNVRYPYPLDLNIEDMQLALKDAERIKFFVLEKISSDDIQDNESDSNDE